MPGYAKGDIVYWLSKKGLLHIGKVHRVVPHPTKGYDDTYEVHRLPPGSGLQTRTRAQLEHGDRMKHNADFNQGVPEILGF